MKNKILSVIWFVLLLTNSAWPQDQGTKITGYVYDIENNTPLSGVNIYIGGTQFGTTSNSDGFFNMKVKKLPVVLYFSYVGYEVKQYPVNSAEKNVLKIYLKPEIHKISEVTISGERIKNLFKGDTLNIVDYEISGDQIIMVANPYKSMDDQRLYLTSLSGEILTSQKIRNAGHEVDVPESIAIKIKLYLFKDCYRNIQLLTTDNVFQVFVNQNNLNLVYPTPFEQFMKLLFPAKAVLNNRLFYQKTTTTKNETYCIEEGDKKTRLIKTVSDPNGPYRYARPIHFLGEITDPDRLIIKGSYEKCVSAPIIQRRDDIAVFDFFGNTMDFFNSDGICQKSVRITFHLKEYYELLLIRMRDIDQANFTQQILYDEQVNRIWSVWRQKSNGRYSLKEINPDTGGIVRVVEIPDYPFIDKIQVHNNIVYFLYLEKKYPFYRSLYRMGI